MPSNDYQFVTHWRVPGEAADVYRTLIDIRGYRRWWPQVYLEVKELAAGDPTTGVGKVCDLLTKGRLPYTLRWRSEIAEGRPPDGFTVAATGDFVGRGVWTIRQDGPEVDITFDWRLRAEKPLIRSLSILFKPLFRANHLWAMARGQEGLRAELARPRAAGAA